MKYRDRQLKSDVADIEHFIASPVFEDMDNYLQARIAMKQADWVDHSTGCGVEEEALMSRANRLLILELNELRKLPRKYLEALVEESLREEDDTDARG